MAVSTKLTSVMSREEPVSLARGSMERANNLRKRGQPCLMLWATGTESDLYPEYLK